MTMFNFYKGIPLGRVRCFLHLVLVSALFVVLACSNGYAQASTIEDGQKTTGVSQFEAPNLNTTIPPGQNNQPESGDSDGILSSNEKQYGIVDYLYQKIDHVRHRFSNLLTYGTPLPPKRQKSYNNNTIWQNEWIQTPLQLFALIGGIFFVALCIELFSKRYMARFIPEILLESNIKWNKKISALMARFTVDIGALLIFLLSVFAVLFLLPKEVRPGHIVISSCLTAILIIKSAAILSRTLLTPQPHHLRILPISNDTARYIQRRVVIVANIMATGWLISGIIGMFSNLQSVSFLSFLFVSVVVCCVLILICFEKRIPVREILHKTLPQTKIMQEIAGVWHHLAIFYVVIIWVACFLGLLLVGPKTIVPAAVTILAIPSYFLMDWLLQTLVDWWLHVSKNDHSSMPEVEHAGAGDEQLPQSALPTSTITSKTQIFSERFFFGLRFIIRVVLAALLFFYLLSLWGVDLQIGKVITSAALNSIVAILVCVIIWGIANQSIERKLREELPNQDEETEEGGSGGSRTGTLLLLFRKFLLSFLFIIAFVAILASSGVNIGPLIAGAGVIGLAIGFGAQTLVRDIISGVFFLMDDAFRVGDFVDTGSSKGVVEHISLRSLRIRHPRGMVHTIPFGDIPSVTNYSRDYIITKLDIRVPFDTDIDKVRKIVKKIYADILGDDELGPKLLGKMKSQGVRDLDDSALLIRIKFKSIPGEQFVLRREVYERLQEAFHSNGLEFASRKVMVEVPKEVSPKSSNTHVGQAAATAAAAAMTSSKAQQENNSSKI